MKLVKYCTAIVAAGLIQACSTTAVDNSSATIEQLIIAEPMPVNYKSEVALARLTDLIHRAEITDMQRAQLFYDRGVIYDSIGLRSLARIDFKRALRIKPDLVDAYNLLGIHFTQIQEFDRAYEQFDSAIELQPDHEFAFLNRGIALYYGGRPELAQSDLVLFHQKQINDPYRILWLYFADYAIDPEMAKVQLKARAEGVSNSTWAKSVIGLFLGEVSQNQFIYNLPRGVQSNKELTQRLCEAYFYLGKFNEYNGRYHAAANFYKLALGTNVYEFVEHRYAKLELDLMRADLQQAAAQSR